MKFKIKYYGKFDLETLRAVSNYISCSRVYLSDIEYYEQKEKELNWGKVRRIITSTYSCPFTNEQLKKILEII